MPRTRIESIVKSVTPDTALRLAKFFRTTPHMWTNMQAAYDLKVAARTIDLGNVEVLDAA